MNIIKPVLIWTALLLGLMCITVLNATHFQLSLSRCQALPIWLWILPFLMVGMALLATGWLKATQNDKNLWRYGAVRGGYFGVFYFLFTLSGSTLDPQVAWALLMGLLAGLLSCVVLAVQRKSMLLTNPPGELQ